MKSPSDFLDRRDRTRLLAWAALYSAVGLGWAALARWVVPPMLVAEHPWPMVEAVKAYLKPPPILFLRQDPLDYWREFSEAVLIALVLHFSIVVILGRYDRRAAEEESSRPSWRDRFLNVALGLLAMAFLAVAVLAPARQDYFFYLEIWYHVRHGEDPWFTVPGMNGVAPLNAYGPLFNPLAAVAWLNPVAPRLLFAHAYLLFAVCQTKSFAAGHRGRISALALIGLLALFWNPFPWVEVAFYGHFDLLVGLASLAAVRALRREQEVVSGAWLASGVLLKYLPIVLVPFLASDRGRRRPRRRFLTVVVVSIAVGLGLSLLVWGPSTFLPLMLATTRRSVGASFYAYLNGRYSPILRLALGSDLDATAPVVQLAALGWAWWWSWTHKLDVEASTLVAVLILVLLYRVGYPQYQMVPVVLGSAWLLGQWDRLRNRIAPAVAMTFYFGCLAAVDLAYMLNEACHVALDWGSLEASAGLPIFLFGGALIGSVLWTSPREAAS